MISTEASPHINIWLLALAFVRKNLAKKNKKKNFTPLQFDKHWINKYLMSRVSWIHISRNIFSNHSKFMEKKRKKTKLNHLRMVMNKYLLLFIEDEEMKVKLYAKFSLNDLNVMVWEYLESCCKGNWNFVVCYFKVYLEMFFLFFCCFWNFSGDFAFHNHNNISNERPEKLVFKLVQ